jgi:hypothetical protein
MEPEKYILLTTTPVPLEISEVLPAKPVNGEESSLRASACVNISTLPSPTGYTMEQSGGYDVST